MGLGRFGEVLVELFFWFFSDYYHMPWVIIGVSLAALLFSVVEKASKDGAPTREDWREIFASTSQILLFVTLVLALLAGLTLGVFARPQKTVAETPPASIPEPPNPNYPTPTKIPRLPILPTYSPTPTSTPTDTPTSTPTSTDTPTPTPTPTPTLTPTPEPPPPKPPDPPKPDPDQIPDVPAWCGSEGLRITRIEPNAHSIPAGSDIKIWGTAQHSTDMHFDRFFVEAQATEDRPAENAVVGWDYPIGTLTVTIQGGLLATWRFQDWQQVFPGNMHTLTVWVRVRGISGGNARSMPRECLVKLTLNR